MPANKRGRKNAYITKIEPRLLEIAAWCRDGLTDKQMCELLDVSHETFYKHKREQPEFSDALKVNKSIADINVENSLYKRATGFTYEEVTTEEKEDAVSGLTTEIKTKKVTKLVVPDTTAQIFWMKNRMPDKWRDKQETEISGNIGVANVDPEKYLKEKGIPLPGAEDLEDIDEMEEVFEDLEDIDETCDVDDEIDDFGLNE